MVGLQWLHIRNAKISTGPHNHMSVRLLLFGAKRRVLSSGLNPRDWIRQFFFLF